MESCAKLQEIKAPKQSNSTTQIPKTLARHKKMGEYNHPPVNCACWHKLWLHLQRNAKTCVVTFFYKFVVDLFLSRQVFSCCHHKTFNQSTCHHLTSSSLVTHSTRELNVSQHHLCVFILVWNLLLIIHLEKVRIFKTQQVHVFDQ